MRMILNEVRRYFHPLVLLLIVLLSLGWYLIYETGCSFYLKGNIGMPYKVAKEYLQRFGPTFDSQEIEMMRKDHADMKRKVDHLVDQYMGSYDIHTLDEYEAYSDNPVFEKGSDEQKKALDEWGQTEYDRRLSEYRQVEEIFWSEPVLSASMELQSIEEYVDAFDFLLEAKAAFVADPNDEEWFFSDATDSEKERLEQRYQREEIAAGQGPLMIAENFENFYENWSLLILLCCTLLVLPLSIKNKSNGLTPMQYSTKPGKGLLKKQLAAALLSSLLVSMILILVFHIFYFWDGGSCFADVPLSLGPEAAMLWFDFSLRGFMLCLWGKTLLLVVSEVLIIFWISCHSTNYVTAIAFSVPVIAIFHWICGRADDMLRMFHGWPRAAYPVTLSVTAAAAAVCSGYLLHRAKKSDYL